MKRSGLYILLVTVIIFSGCSCGRSNRGGHEQKVDSPAKNVAVDTAAVRPHQQQNSARATAPQRRPGRSPASVEENPPPPPPPQPAIAPTKGSVAYYCPPKMIIDQEYFVTVSIAKEQLSQLIRETRRDILALSPKADTADVKGDSIMVTDKMKVVLVCSRDFFKIVDSPDVSAMSFGNDGKLDWNWLIQPTTVTNSIPIEIRVYAFNLNHDNDWTQVNHPVKSFFINVRVDPRSFWDKLLTFLNDDPKFLLSQILIPLFAFIGGILVGRRKKKQKP